MTPKNNLGGIILTEFLFADEFQNFTIDRSQAIYSLLPGVNWRRIPTPYMGATLNSEPQDSLYSFRYSVRIPSHMLSPALLSVLETTSVRGCVLHVVDANYVSHIVGSVEHPLFGKLSLSPGSKGKEISGYTLEFSGKSIHPPVKPLVL